MKLNVSHAAEELLNALSPPALGSWSNSGLPSARSIAQRLFSCKKDDVVMILDLRMFRAGGGMQGEGKTI